MNHYHQTKSIKSQKIDEPIVQNKAQDRLLELFNREELPGTVRENLAGALSGNLARQQLMFQAMIDTTPRLQKNLAEVADAVKGAKWQFTAKKMRGEEEPSKEAIERMEFIEDAFKDTSPSVVRNEKNHKQVVRDLVYGYYMGHHVTEIHWQNRDGIYNPRAYKSVPPRFYGYPFFDEDDDRLMFDPSGRESQEYIDFPEDRFLIAMNSGHTGHMATSAPLRALTGYWLASNFGLKWLMSFSQLYGVPFRWGTYSDELGKKALSTMLQNIGSTGWASVPKGTDIEFKDAAKGVGSLPQQGLIDMANEAFDIFILGQTLTSSQGDTGSQALGNVHNEVRQGVFQKVGDYVGDILNTQLIPSISKLNYGDVENLPTIEPVFEKKEDPKLLAERDAMLISMGMEVDKDWLYDRHGVPIPKDEKNIFKPASTPDGGQGDPDTGGGKPPIETKEKEGKKKDKVKAAFDPEQDRGDDGRWIDRGEVNEKIQRTRDLIANGRTEESIISDLKLASEGDIPIPKDLDDKIDVLAYGYADGEMITTATENIDIFWTDDLVNPQHLFDTQGMDWANSVDFSEPVELGVDEVGKLYIEDGHHRWFASGKLGREVTGQIVKFKGNPLVKIIKDGVANRAKPDYKIEGAFNPNQDRDENGMWTDGGLNDTEKKATSIMREGYRKAKTLYDMPIDERIKQAIETVKKGGYAGLSKVDKYAVSPMKNVRDRDNLQEEFAERFKNHLEKHESEPSYNEGEFLDTLRKHNALLRASNVTPESLETQKQSIFSKMEQALEDGKLLSWEPLDELLKSTIK